MPYEIERKFLVTGDGWREGSVATEFQQAYLHRGEKGVVRARIAGAKAFLTVKSAGVGLARKEFEYEIPVQDATELLDLAEGPVLRKTRHVVVHGGRKWEVDVFHGENDGLVLAEVELPDAEANVALPAWVGEEVTRDARYYSSNLALRPFRDWK
jgi:adenylate cyclase